VMTNREALALEGQLIREYQVNSLISSADAVQSEHY
jgi:hypothetical protein